VAGVTFGSDRVVERSWQFRRSYTGPVTSRVRDFDEQLRMLFVLTVTWDDSDNIWRYGLSATSGDTVHTRAAFGRVLAADHRAATLRAAELIAEGYAPGSVERGLFDALARGEVVGW
jgi:hypothetical protein